MANGSGSRGPPPQGRRARLARAGGCGGIPQKLTLIGGFTLGLVPLPLTVQTGSCGDFSEEQSLLTAPLTTGVGCRQLVKLVLRPPPCILRPSYRAGVGTAAEGAPWILRLLQGPGSGVQASLKVLLQHLACGPPW